METAISSLIDASRGALRASPGRLGTADVAGNDRYKLLDYLVLPRPRYADGCKLSPEESDLTTQAVNPQDNIAALGQ